MVVFVVMQEAPEVTLESARDYAAEVIAYGRAHHGRLPRGFQSGVMTFPVIASPEIEPAAADWARSRPQKHWALEENPVLVDPILPEAFTYTGPIAWGRVYSKFRRDIVDRHLLAPLAG
jgi:hypothetical protein